MKSYGSIVFIFAVGVTIALGYRYFSNQSPAVKTTDAIETSKESQEDALERTFSQNDRKPKPAAIPSPDVDSDVKDEVETQLLYKFAENGSEAYLNARDMIPDATAKWEVLQYEIVRTDWSAVMHVMSKGSGKVWLRKEYSIPMFGNKSCNFSGRRIVELDTGGRIHVNGKCKDYGTFMGGYTPESNHYSFVVRAHDQSAMYVVEKLSQDHAVLIQVPYPPESKVVH